MSSPPDIARVVVAFDACGVSAPVLQLAAGFAVCLRTTLAGLYVEDERLMRVAALPFSRETGLISGTQRRVSADSLRHDLQAQATRMRRELAALAEPLSLRWTLDIAQGELRSTSLALTSASDLLVFGQAPWFPAPAVPTTGARWNPAALARHPVAVVLDESDSAFHALATARALVELTGSDLLVFITAADAASFRRRHAEAMKRLGAIGKRTRYLQRRDPSWEALVQAARSQQAAAIIRARSDGLEGVTGQGLACPLVLIP
jgi:hypothetical protein